MIRSASNDVDPRATDVLRTDSRQLERPSSHLSDLPGASNPARSPPESFPQPAEPPRPGSSRQRRIMLLLLLLPLLLLLLMIIILIIILLVMIQFIFVFIFSICTLPRYMHDKHVLHRDLKSQNLFLTSTDRHILLVIIVTVFNNSI